MVTKEKHKLLNRLTRRFFSPILSPFCRGKVAMFHIGRSGSTVMDDMLSQHPYIYWDGEVYEKVFKSLERSGKTVQVGYQSPAIDPVNNTLRKRMRRSGKDFYGFEVKFFHLRLLGISLPDYIENLCSLGFSRFIVLKRKNYLKKIVSSLISHKTKQFYMWDTGEVALHQIDLDINNIEIDRDAKPLLEFLQDYDERFVSLDKILESRATLKLTYEDDVLPDPRLGYEKICNFLNIVPKEPKVRLVKMNPYKLNELIGNFEDVKRALHETPFAWMLRE